MLASSKNVGGNDEKKFREKSLDAPWHWFLVRVAQGSSGALPGAATKPFFPAWCAQCTPITKKVTYRHRMFALGAARGAGAIAGCVNWRRSIALTRCWHNVCVEGAARTWGSSIPSGGHEFLHGLSGVSPLHANPRGLSRAPRGLHAMPRSCRFLCMSCFSRCVVCFRRRNHEPARPLGAWEQGLLGVGPGA